MSLKDYRFDGEEKLELRGMNTGAKKDGVDKEDILRRTEKNLGQRHLFQWPEYGRVYRKTAEIPERRHQY